MPDQLTQRTLDDLATLMQCVRCGGPLRREADAFTCSSGHTFPIADGVVMVRADDEDPAVERERHAVLELEQGHPDQFPEGSTDFTLRSLLATRGPVQQAFLSLPYDDGSAFYRGNEYFRNVAGFAGAFDHLIGQLDLPPGSRVLDVGADLTWSTARLARRGWRPVGIDINHHLTASRLFHEQGIAYGVVNVDMHAPAFRDEAFDAAVAINALHHTHRLAPLMANLTRVLKPGGRFAFVEPYWYHEAVRQAFGAEQIEAGINENVYRLEEWHQTLVSHGLEIRSFAPSHAFIGVYEKRAGGAPRALTLHQATEELFGPFYGARLELTQAPVAHGGAGQAITVPVRVTNASTWTWCREGQVPVHVSYHLYVATAPGVRGRMLAFDNVRSHLPEFLPPGRDVVVEARVDCPVEPGSYVIEFDLVHEGVTWFAERLLPPVRVALTVSA